jgi:hypothetical protein
MTVGTFLTLLGGTTALFSILLVLMAFSAHNQPEGTASAVWALSSLPFAATTILSTAAASMVYARYGAKRRAAVLGVVAAVSILASCAWLYALV